MANPHSTPGTVVTFPAVGIFGEGLVNEFFSNEKIFFFIERYLFRFWMSFRVLPFIMEKKCRLIKICNRDSLVVHFSKSASGGENRNCKLLGIFFSECGNSGKAPPQVKIRNSKLFPCNKNLRANLNHIKKLLTK